MSCACARVRVSAVYSRSAPLLMVLRTPLISPPLVVRIYSPWCLSLFSKLQDYLSAAWQFLGTMKCHLGKYYLS